MNPHTQTTAFRRMVFSLALMLGAVATFTGTQPVLARRPTPSPSPTAIPTPSPTPVPTPPPFAARMVTLNEELVAIARAAPGNLGIAVYDPESDTHIAVHGDKSFPLASTYKLAIALAAFHEADERKISLDTLVAMQPSDLRHGHSPLAEQYPQGGASFPLWKLVHDMIAESDNTATDMVLRAIGDTSDVQQTLNYFSIAGFSIRKSEADLYDESLAHKTFAHGGDNAGTPDGMAALLIGVANLKFLSLDSSTEFVLDLAQAHTNDNRLRAGLPAAARFAHKAGTSATFDGMTDATNDAGLLTTPDGHRIAIVAFLSESPADEATRDAVLASVGKAVYSAFVP
jgi:beta-lactamase class A